jgi:hypothetical protein
MAKGNAFMHLRLVVSSEDEDTSVLASKNQDPVQLPLLHFHDPRLLGLVDMSIMTAGPFIALLKGLRPQWVMDLRSVPLFDLGGTNRKWFFELFQQLGVRYRDVSGRLGITSSRDRLADTENVALIISAMLAQVAVPEQLGPVLILLDGPEGILKTERFLLPKLQPSPRGGWAVHRLDARTAVHTG